MISNDLSNLAYRLDDYATEHTSPSPLECGRIAAELRKLARIVAQMEGLPFDRDALQVKEPLPTPESEWEFRRPQHMWQKWLGSQRDVVVDRARVSCIRRHLHLRVDRGDLDGSH